MNRWTKLTSRVVASLTLLVFATATVAQDYDLIELEPPGFEIAQYATRHQ